jgi:hypothetical protein
VLTRLVAWCIDIYLRAVLALLFLPLLLFLWLLGRERGGEARSER